MIVEEKMARDFKCPQQMTLNYGPNGYNCQGSCCMAWRWAKGTDKYIGDDDLPLEGVSTTHGYCGLAGRP